jgi:hypothetical protein
MFEASAADRRLERGAQDGTSPITWTIYEMMAKQTRLGEIEAGLSPLSR